MCEEAAVKETSGETNQTITEASSEPKLASEGQANPRNRKANLSGPITKVATTIIKIKINVTTETTEISISKKNLSLSRFVT